MSTLTARAPIVVVPTHEVAARAADVIAEVVGRRPDAVLGYATGRTPLALYAELARRVHAGALDLSATRAVALDEYAGLAASDPRSFAAYLRREVVGPLGIDPRNVHLLDGSGASEAVLAGRCAAYDTLLDALGVDLQVVGIGRNGHLAFNEPGTPFGATTRVTVLAESTRRDNADAFGGDPSTVPSRALTQGPATIARAHTILLVATGGGKADAVAAAFDGPIDPVCPASLLQRHPHLRAVLDPPAAAGLSRRGRGFTPSDSPTAKEQR